MVARICFVKSVVCGTIIVFIVVTLCCACCDHVKKPTIKRRRECIFACTEAESETVVNNDEILSNETTTQWDMELVTSMSRKHHQQRDRECLSLLVESSISNSENNTKSKLIVGTSLPTSSNSAIDNV